MSSAGSAGPSGPSTPGVPGTPSRPPWPVPAGQVQRARRGRPILVVVAVGVAILLGLALFADVGSTGLFVGASLALLPVVPVTWAFLWLDRWEPEPPRALLWAFLWGAIVAAGIALVVNSLAGALLTSVLDSDTALAATAVVVAPAVEEAAKGSFLLVYVWRHRYEFDGVVDGIVLAGLCGAGFAFTENILYFGRAFTQGWADAGLAGGLSESVVTFVVRGIVSPFAHPLFTCMTGIGVGIAVWSRRAFVRRLAPLSGYAAAVALHASWNGAAFASGQTFISLYLGFMVPVFAVAAGLAVWQRRREGTVVRRHLPAYAAAGWLGGWEVASLASLPARRALVSRAGESGGPPLANATKRYHATATELAFLRERMARHTAGPDAARIQDALLAALALRRQEAFVPYAVTSGPPRR